MKTGRLISSCLRTLGRNKLRTAFMMLGTLIGVTALTVVGALGQGTQDEIMERFRTMFAGSRIQLMAVAESHTGMQANLIQSLTLDDLDAIQREVPAVVLVDPMQFVGSGDLVYDGNASRTAVRGHSEHYPIVADRDVTRGSFFSPQDVRASARVALVGETLVAKVFGDVDPVGETVRVGTIPFEIIGVLEPIGLDPHGIDRDNEIIIPISTMMRRVMNVDYLNSASLMVRTDADLEVARQEVERLLRERHQLAAGVPDDFRTYTPLQVERMVESGNRVFTVLLPLVALISIVVGAGVVANVMLMSVNERRSEVGLRKAVGARPRDIWWQVVLETTLVTTLGGVAAIGLAGAGLALVQTHIALPGSFPWTLTLIGLTVSVMVGVLAGVFPARRAAALNPIDSLR